MKAQRVQFGYMDLNTEYPWIFWTLNTEDGTPNLSLTPIFLPNPNDYFPT